MRKEYRDLRPGMWIWAGGTATEVTQVTFRSNGQVQVTANPPLAHPERQADASVDVIPGTAPTARATFDPATDRWLIELDVWAPDAATVMVNGQELGLS